MLNPPIETSADEYSTRSALANPWFLKFIVSNATETADGFMCRFLYEYPEPAF